MISSVYTNFTTSRSVQYHYHVSPPAVASKPTLLFLHGFPSTSYDWRYQVEFFESRGYGVIVPDMLGYGGTDKPTDPSAYKASLICKDVIDILDKEQLEQIIAVGHDLGSKIVSRLANYYPERFIAFAFLAVSYTEPRVDFNLDKFLAFTKQKLGYELFGYWSLFSEADAHKLIEAKFDSFYSLALADDTKLWMSDFGPTGALRSWVEADKKTPAASYLSEEEKEAQKAALLKGGLEGPFCWYKVMTSDIDSEDVKSIPVDNHIVHKPVFFGAAKQDYVCLPALGKAVVAQFCKGPVTVRDFDTGHWIMWQARDELNQELLEWIEGLNTDCKM